MPSSITKETKITISLLIVILAATLAGAGFLYDMRSQITVLNEDHYGETAASEDALREAMANPGHKVPDPRRPGEYHLVPKVYP